MRRHSPLRLPAMCGVRKTLGRDNSGESFGGGSHLRDVEQSRQIRTV